MAPTLPIYMDYHATTPWTRASSRRCCRTSPSTSATPPAATTASAGTPKRRSKAPRKQVARSDRRDTRRKSSSRAARPSRTTSRSRASPRCPARRATTSSPRVHRAQGGDRHLQAAREAGLHASRICRSERTAASIPRRCAGAITAETILITSWPRTTRSASIQPIARDRRDHARAQGASCPHRRRAGRRQDAVQRRSARGRPRCRCSAHKMYGPKGVGALYVRRQAPRVLLSPLDRRRRPRARHASGHAERARHRRLRQGRRSGAGRDGGRIDAARRAARSPARARSSRSLPGVDLTADIEHRLPHNLNICFTYVEGESLLMGINDVAVSSGSACTSPASSRPTC